jgi:hypothetical protein
MAVGDPAHRAPITMTSRLPVGMKSSPEFEAKQK